MTDARPFHESIKPGHARYVFTLLFLLYMFDYIDRLVIVSLFPFLKSDWGLSDAQCGLLVSAVYWSILIFTLPTALLVDRWSRKKSIGIMALLWSAATIACAFTRNFTQLFTARALIGLGEAGYAPGGTALIAALFPPEKRARVLGLWNASIPLGSALGIALGGAIAEHFGWRHAFGIVALPGMVIALFMFRIQDYQTVSLVKSSPSARAVRMSAREIAGRFWRKKSLTFNNLAFAANVFVTTALLSWLPSYFHRVEGLAMSAAGVKGGAVMLLAIVGAPLGGYLADRWYRKNLRARLLFAAGSSAVTAVLLFIVFSFLQGIVQYAVLLLAGITAVAFVPASVSVTQDVVHPGLRALSLSLNIIIQHILGSSLGPPVIGALSDRYGLEAAMTVLPLFALCAGGLYWIASRHYERDLASAERVDLVAER